MGAFAYVNGRFTPHAEACVHIEDRGYQFADGVYEVVAVHRGRIVDWDRHITRLGRSLSELAMAWPLPAKSLAVVSAELIRRNRLKEGALYLQVTRGVAPRDHAYPAHAKPALVMTTKRVTSFDFDALYKGVSVITIPDIRWQRRDIKSISLLPNCMGKQAAVEAGAYEAWMVEDGFVTEGTSSNAWILTNTDTLVTRKAGPEILNGVTRLDLADIAKRDGITLEERPFTVDEAKAAREAFVTSTTSFVKPVVRIDDQPVGTGEPGPMGRKLLQAFLDHVSQDTAP